MRQRNCAYLFGRDGALIRLAELLDDSGVPSEILLAADENDGTASAEVKYLRVPLEGTKVLLAGPRMDGIRTGHKHLSTYLLLDVVQGVG